MRGRWWILDLMRGSVMCLGLLLTLMGWERRMVYEMLCSFVENSFFVPAGYVDLQCYAENTH
jgi:hypothetical protein